MPVSPGPLLTDHELYAWLVTHHPSVVRTIEAAGVAAERERIRVAVEKMEEITDWQAEAVIAIIDREDDHD